MERIKSASLWIFLGLLGYMPLHIFLSTWFGTTFGLLESAKVFKDVILVVGFLLALFASVREDWFKALLKDKLVWLITVYGVLTLLLALLKPTDQDAEILGVVYNLRFLLFFAYGILLAYLFEPGQVRRMAVKVVMAVALPVLAFGIFQYTLLPNNALSHVGYARVNGVLPAFFIDDKPDLERAMSTLRDPNSFGSYIIIILSIALAYFVGTRNRDLKKAMAGFVGLCALSLWYTFSRSAWLGAITAVIIIGTLNLKSRRSIKLNNKLIVITVAVVVVALLSLISMRNTYFVQNVVFHADQSTTLEDPNQLRTRFWRESLNDAVHTPLGHGPGTAGLASIRNQVQGTVLNENYYFQILHEAGFIGFGLFIAILVVVGLRLYRRINDPLALALFAAFLGLAVTNFLVHIWSNEAVAYIFWGLTGLVVVPAAQANRVSWAQKLKK